MDTLTKPQRHKNMSHIRATGGSLETSLRSQLFRFGFRFRKNDKRLSGSPDIVFPHYHALIFINGCFWHSHGWKSEKSLLKSPVLEQPVLYSSRCGKFRMPGTNLDFWQEKFDRNRERDLRDIKSLLEEGWRVGVVWECAITGPKRRDKIYDVASHISLWLEEGFDQPFREFY
ncbi:MAG: very short patch repair endonuclease [Treponemataceae bacterium]|nr:very short patch repair endonuclease [Treponemataceae bacterium]